MRTPSPAASALVGIGVFVVLIWSLAECAVREMPEARPTRPPVAASPPIAERRASGWRREASDGQVLVIRRGALFDAFVNGERIDALSGRPPAPELHVWCGSGLAEVSVYHWRPSNSRVEVVVDGEVAPLGAARAEHQAITLEGGGAADLLTRLLSARRMTVAVSTPRGSVSVRTAFSLSGLTAALGDRRAACGL